MLFHAFRQIKVILNFALAYMFTTISGCINNEEDEDWVVNVCAHNDFKKLIYIL